MAKAKKRKDLSQGWLMTFTDMLMLLVVMFVLFLSFSEIDSESFKRNAGPIAEAFNQPPSTSLLSGKSALIDMSTTNVNAEDPGEGIGFEVKADQKERNDNIKPKEEKSTEIKEKKKIKEKEIKTAEVKEEKNIEAKEEKNIEAKENKAVNLTETEKVEENQQKPEKVKEIRSNKLSRNLETVMKDEIRAGKFELVAKKNVVTLRFPEKVTFFSGVADLQKDIQPTLDRIASIISKTETQDKIVVTGHTDSVPISTYRFRSNWDLSAARAVSVVHRILRNKNIDRKRVLAVGSADVNPLASNDSWENRALNRRVEIRIELSDSITE